MKPNKKLAAGLATALAAGALSAVGLAAPAQAATTTTGTIHGSPVNQAGTTWYDNGAFPGVPEPGNPAQTITLTAVQDGADIDISVGVTQGPYTSALSGPAANSYRLDAFVEVDGVAKRLVGTVGTIAVGTNQPTYVGGTTITGTVANAGLGAHTVELTDFLMDSVGQGTPVGFGTLDSGADAAGFDAFYNLGTTTADVVARTSPIGLTENVTLVAQPTTAIASVSNQMAGVTGYVRGAGTVGGVGQNTPATVALTGTNWGENVVAGGITSALCDAAGTVCDAAVANTLVTDGDGDLTGNVPVPATAVAGNRSIKLSAGSVSTVSPIKVLGTPSITVSPAVGTTGTVATITGSNFNPLGFGVGHASIANPNGFCFLADGPTPGAPCNDPVGNFPVGPYVSGAINQIVGITADATGNVSGSVTVADPASIKVQYSQKTIVSGAPVNTNLDMTGVGADTSKAGNFKVDDTAPTATAAVAPTSGNVGITSTLTLSNIVDATAVTTAVTWGDGSATQQLAAGVTTATHKFTKAGTFPVSVVLTDAAGNASAVIAAGTVTVKTPPVVVPPVVKDTTAPVVKVKALKAKASKNKAVAGTITDKGTGPKSVTIKVIEKRGSKWYAFNGKKFVKVKSKKAALKKAKSLTDSSVASGWSIKVKGLKKGTVYVTYFGTDKAGNKSATKTYSKKLK